MRTIRLVLVTIACICLPVPVAQAAFPGGNGDIAFSRFTRNQTDIWIVYSGQTGTTRLTATPRRNEGMPDWNAAGTRVAFSRCGRGKTSNCEIWTMAADGTDRVRLTDTPAQETWPAWSPDGTRVAYTSNASGDFQDIWVMDADGANQTRLTMTPGFDAFPEWSPDGATIAFTSDRAALDDIWVMDADGGNPRRLTSGPRADERPDWSPDGASIAFARRGDIWIMDADGTDERPVSETARDEFAPAFSPNGLRIAFARHDRTGRVGVWNMRVDGAGQVQRTFGRFDFFPDWQPR